MGGDVVIMWCGGGGYNVVDEPFGYQSLIIRHIFTIGISSMERHHRNKDFRMLAHYCRQFGKDVRQANMRF